MSKITGARFIAETLEGYGVSHIFYVEAILRHTLVELEKLGVKRILAHSEKAAAYMADGFARVSRKPGVCMAQSVGAANLAAGLQDAYLGFSPVIALTGRKSPFYQYRNAYQEILHNTMYDPVTKYNVRVETNAQLPQALRQAFREATTGSPRPVHLDLPGLQGADLEEQEVDGDVVVEDCFKHAPAKRPLPEADSLKNVARLLAKAERPVLVAGRGAILSSAGPEIDTISQKLSLPIATSPDGKGIVPEGSNLSVGVVGAYGRSCASQVVSEADLVLFVGCGIGDQVTHDWTIPQQGIPIIQIDINPAELGKNYPDTLGLAGDAKSVLAKLIAIVESEISREAWIQRVHEVVHEWENEAKILLESEAVPIHPARLCRNLTQTLPDNAILFADTGYSAMWTGKLISLSNPEQNYYRAAGSLGWAFPASLGAKCAALERPVICFTGDGGFWYHLSELETALRWDINTVTVVNNNSGLLQGLEGINQAYGEYQGHKEHMYKFREVNFAQIAQEIGCLGIRVEHPNEIISAFKEALSVNKPVVVDVVTNPDCRPPD
jgi:acetolactate synthase-1/2/3 large subunit